MTLSLQQADDLLFIVGQHSTQGSKAARALVALEDTLAVQLKQQLAE